MRFKKGQEPNKQELARLLELAKGDRTYKDFADELGVSQSTLSRIKDGRNKGSSSPDLMEKIASHAAAGSGVTYRQLMEANGYVFEYRAADRGIELRAKIGEMENIIVNGLLDREISIQRVSPIFKISKQVAMCFDLVLRTALFSVEPKLWALEMLPPYADRAATNDSREWRHKPLQKAFSVMSQFALLNATAVVNEIPVRISLVTSEKVAYNVLINEFDKIILPFQMSFILIDMANKQVEEEVFLPAHGCDAKPVSVFERPITVFRDPQKAFEYETKEDTEW